MVAAMKKPLTKASELTGLMKQRGDIQVEIEALKKQQSAIEQEIDGLRPEYQDQTKSVYNWVTDSYVARNESRLVKSGDVTSIRILLEEKQSVVRSRVRKETELKVLDGRIQKLGGFVDGAQMEIRVAPKKYEDVWFMKVDELRPTMKLEAAIAQVFEDFMRASPKLKASVSGFKRQYHKWQVGEMRTKPK
jgi:hypothetical protein